MNLRIIRPLWMIICKRPVLKEEKEEKFLHTGGQKMITLRLPPTTITTPVQSR